MKKLIIAVLFIMLVVPSVSQAWTSWNVGFSGGGGGHGYSRGMNVGIRGGSHGNFHRSVRRHAVHRSFRGGYGGYRGGGMRVVRGGYGGYRGGGYYGGYVPRVCKVRRHIHRQAGRVYYQGSCLPVVVVPSGVVYHY